MLDLSVSTVITDEAWSTLDRRAVMPKVRDEEDPMGSVSKHDPRRKRRRISLPGRGLLVHGNPLVGESLISGVYTVDFSADGLGLYSPMQLLPKERVTLILPNCDPLKLSAMRCRKIEASCYRCGMVYDGGPLTPGKFRTLIDQLQS